MKTPKTADELRDSFLSFFESKNHLIMPSSSLIPSGDPTLLLTNSGMAQFKAYFSGEKEPPNKRITTSQKCFRTTDIEEVGDDTHLTLFEMLGNFSFGDYFKKEACEWALEFMIDILGFEKERLFFTVYTDDDETKQIWIDLGIEKKYIYKFGDEDNWWGPAGEEGPCGPCSELHYYQGDISEMDFDNPNWGPNIHDDFIELYNLVFTQFYRDLDGNDKSLPFNNIDTGMGLERTVSVLNKKETAYKTDIFKDHLEFLDKKISEQDNESQKYKRIIAEHGRSASFLIADGVLPENTGRGYVLRRLIRRGMITAKKLGLSFPILSPMANITSKKLSHVYPELEEKLKFITSVLDKEEQNFNKTLNFGTQVLNQLIKKRGVNLKDTENFKASEDVANEIFSKIDNEKSKKILSGREAFVLYDTYGFPIEITTEICMENGLEVDRSEFLKIMEEQKTSSKNSSEIKSGNLSQKLYSSLKIKPTEFTGFETLETESKILEIIQDNKIVEKINNEEVFEIITDKSPFYAEKGGQVGDKGTGISKTGEFNIIDTISPYGGIFVHKSKMKSGEITKNSTIKLIVEEERREKIKRNHTATHLLHAALREIIGIHVRQSGSLVHPDYLRFDFTSLESLDESSLKNIEFKVNEYIRNNIEVEVCNTTYNKAIEEGAIAFFDDKYDNDVRTIRIDAPWSFELCGGTHMDRTGGIGLFKIISESGIGSGNRRIFATTGIGTENIVDNNQSIVSEITKALSSNNEDVIEKFNQLQKLSKEQQKEIENLNIKITNLSMGNTDKSISQEFEIGSTKISCSKVSASNIGALRNAGDTQRTRLGKGLAILGSIIEDKGVIVIMATDDIALEAGEVAKIIAKEVNGGGGGNKFSAQVGIKDINDYERFFSNSKNILENNLK
ncbi:MAG: alanine--tRNA ligase [Dehalococcoidia bacterium]|tara:strand:- start:7820 stop:10528 length:2709 start_codon:yes stop_codon:yes gene_type:complete